MAFQRYRRVVRRCVNILEISVNTSTDKCNDDQQEDHGGQSFEAVQEHIVAQLLRDPDYFGEMVATELSASGGDAMLATKSLADTLHRYSFVKWFHATRCQPKWPTHPEETKYVLDVIESAHREIYWEEIAEEIMQQHMSRAVMS